MTGKKKRRDENTQQVKEEFSLFFSADSQAGKNDNENVYTRKASHERTEQKQQQKRREQSSKKKKKKAKIKMMKMNVESLHCAARHPKRRL